MYHAWLACQNNKKLNNILLPLQGLPQWLSSKESACNAGATGYGFDPWVRKIPWSWKWPPTPVFLLGNFHGQRSLVGYSPWGCEVLDTTEQVSYQALQGHQNILPSINSRQTIFMVLAYLSFFFTTSKTQL